MCGKKASFPITANLLVKGMMDDPDLRMGNDFFFELAASSRRLPNTSPKLEYTQSLVGYHEDSYKRKTLLESDNWIWRLDKREAPERNDAARSP